MSRPEPNITVNVDVTNPGQFFACCGLLELADRLWPGAEVVGSFTAPRFERSHFCIFGNDQFTTNELMSVLMCSTRTSVDPYRPIMGSNGKPVADAKKTKPVMFEKPVSLRLSWWLDELAGEQTGFKMWGAHQTSEGLIGDMARAICADEITDDTVLQSRTGMTGRIGLDTRSSWNTLDEGFSPNDQTLPVDTYPATELLAAIGLETFRPTPLDDGYLYACWSTAIPTIVARAVASGNVDSPVETPIFPKSPPLAIAPRPFFKPILAFYERINVNIQGTTRYRFEIGKRGKFGFFSKGSPIERDHYD